MRVEQQNQILEALQQAAGKDVKTASGIVAEKAKTTMRKCRRKVFPWIPQIHIRLLR